MIKAKIVSSLEKVFVDSKIENYPELKRISALRGERLSMQMILTYDVTDSPMIHPPVRSALEVTGALAPYLTQRVVLNVPVIKTINNGGFDDNYLRTSAGLYPDILRPLYYGGKASAPQGFLNTVWLQFEIPEEMEAGAYEMKFRFDGGAYGVEECSVTIEVIGATLPKEDIKYTQWFHADCLANYYNVEVWSDRHWEIVENFVRTARRNGINVLLTPVFTPPLDTMVGGERRTTQLVRVTKTHGAYAFDFALLDRWIDMCDRCGIEYFEISHLFTQWGAAHAPKIMATEDGEYKRIFGWETDAKDPEYARFLRAFITALLAHLQARGDDKRCFFHISDEPFAACLENYQAAKNAIGGLLEDYPIMDALSNYEFYEQGLVKNPIPASNEIKPFLDHGVKDLWAYYCVGQNLKVSNRFQSMPAWRNRCIGMQLYKYNIAGFLQWGYNFYNNELSGDPINPYCDQSADFSLPAGDPFSIYPDTDGNALESPRIVVFYEALQDIKAMKLAEKYYGHDEVVRRMEEAFGKEISFDECTRSAAETLRIREVVNQMIKAKV